MQKRNVRILFRLTEEEAEHLNKLVRKSGRSKEAFLREMVRGYQLCEKPDSEFYKMMRELSAIGNRINQLAVKANALGFVDTPMLREEARKWHEFQIDIRKRYLPPRRSSYYDFVDAENEEEFNSYVGKCKELALYDTGVTVEYGDRLITLSTCEYSAQNGRLVVVAKKVG